MPGCRTLPWVCVCTVCTAQFAVAQCVRYRRGKLWSPNNNSSSSSNNKTKTKASLAAGEISTEKCKSYCFPLPFPFSLSLLVHLPFCRSVCASLCFSWMPCVLLITCNLRQHTRLRLKGKGQRTFYTHTKTIIPKGQIRGGR